MKAILVREFGPPDVLKLEDRPGLEPGPGQVLVRIRAAGVNPVDAYVRSGAYARKPALPYIPGTDAAGLVAAVGPGITKVAPGDRVYTSGTATGTYAEAALCAEDQVHRLADGLTFAQGAAVNIPYATAYRALFQAAKAKPGESVLVHGATGGVGVAAVQLARAAGLRIIGTGGTEAGRDLVMRQGAHFTLDHGKADHLDGLASLTGGRGVDIIIEMSAHLNLGLDLKALAPKGRLVIVGSRGRVEVDPRDIMAREAEVLGVLLFHMPEKEAAELRAALAAGLDGGTLRPVVGAEYPLAEAAEAHRRIMAGGAMGKIVLAP